eukprot:CAMPEP_0119344800 /NCGR_PEP_ID=MMETSP1333-20130426/107156_1 /TAXON_ID=418940 /ORGANISM="Scyphosphaera apsteinii, Strain RCC1455" /LENGTH=154 /DNA_ID=CAMNT_0007357249 /DNA_START=2141 /DNA_END=2602 /DNA_ORIENTATION=-
MVLHRFSHDAFHKLAPLSILRAPCAKMKQRSEEGPETIVDLSLLPGDPSLVLNTNVMLGDAKVNFMKGASAVIASSLKKPEAYVAVAVSDGVSMLFGGSDAPCAVGCVYSLGSINQANNGALTAALSDLLADFGIPSNRIYLNFFDIERANCGW